MSTWPAVALGDVAKVSSGDGAPQEDSAFSSTGTPFIRAGSLVTLTHGTSEEQLELIPEAEAARRRMRVYPPKTVVFAKSGMSCTKGLVHELRCKAHVVNHLAAVECGSDLESRYLLRWFETYTPARLIANPAYPSIKISDIRAEKIPLPPLPEQRRIAKILDAADALRAKRRKSLAQLDTLLQSTFLDMFGDPVTNPKGWEEENFGNLTGNSFRNGLSPSTTGEVKGEVLTLSAITGGSFDFTARKAAQFDREPAVAQRLSKDTFLICRGNGNKKLVGTAAFPDREAESVCFPDTMIGVNIDPSLLTPTYMQTIWKSQRVRYQVERGARTTNGTHKVNQQLLASIRIPLPPIRLQHRFGTIIESVERQKSRLRAHLAELDALFASLQSRAFNGDL